MNNLDLSELVCAIMYLLMNTATSTYINYKW